MKDILARNRTWCDSKRRKHSLYAHFKAFDSRISNLGRDLEARLFTATQHFKRTKLQYLRIQLERYQRHRHAATIYCPSQFIQIVWNTAYGKSTFLASIYFRLPRSDLHKANSLPLRPYNTSESRITRTGPRPVRPQSLQVYQSSPHLKDFSLRVRTDASTLEYFTSKTHNSSSKVLQKLKTYYLEFCNIPRIMKNGSLIV